MLWATARLYFNRYRILEIVSDFPMANTSDRIITHFFTNPMILTYKFK